MMGMRSRGGDEVMTMMIMRRMGVDIWLERL